MDDEAQSGPRTEGQTNYMQYCMTTDMQEDHIVFGGEKRLAEAIREAYRLFKPKAISVYATCPVGLIGDDIHTVCRQAKEELGINVFGFSCEGYKGVSQSAGHHIANNGVFKHMIGLDDTPNDAKYKINILGEYNIGGDAWAIDELLKKCGISILATLSGGVSYDEIINCHQADLNVVMCHRSINYMAEMMETKFGIPWFKVNFIGADSTAKSLRKIAKYFDDKELIDRVEEVIAAELAVLRPIQAEIKAKHQGKKAAIFVGGSRAHHYQDLFGDIGIETVSRAMSSLTATTTRAATCCPTSRSTPTAATSRSSTWSPTKRASARASRPRRSRSSSTPASPSPTTSE